MRHSLSGGDCEWGKRVWKMGYQQVFAPDAVVYHPARSTLAALCEKVRRLAGTDFIRMRAQQGGRKHFLHSAIWRAARHARIVWKGRQEFGHSEYFGGDRRHWLCTGGKVFRTDATSARWRPPEMILV